MLIKNFFTGFLFIVSINTLLAQEFHQYGVDQNHSSTFKTNLVNRVETLKAFPLEALKTSTAATPLIINDSIFWGDYNGVAHFTHLETQKTLWSVNLEKPRIFSTPLYLKKFNRIYFISSIRSSVIDLKNKYAFRTILNSITIDGQNLQRYEISHRQFLNPSSTIHPNELLHCKTAIAFDGKNLNFGCSMYSNFREGYRNRAAKGISGILYRVPLDEKGNVLFTKIDAFIPSVVHPENPDTGYDTGIWQTGASPVVLKDGTILVTTGNGPVFPEQQNYGCALLRLDSSNRKVLNYLLGDEGRYKECEFNSLDFSSSSPVVIDRTAFITSKGGLFVALDPYNFSNKKVFFRTKFSSRAYGQPLAYHSGNKIFAVASGYDKQELLPPVTFLAPESFDKSVGDYKKSKCVGYLKKSGNKQKKLSLFYSGPKMNEYLISNKAVEKIQFERRTYFPLKSSFYWEKADREFLNRFQLKPSTASLRAFKEKEGLNEDDDHIGIQMWSEESKNDQLIYENMETLKDSFEFYVSADKSCSKQIEGMEKLWVYRKEMKPYQPELNLIGVELDKNKKAKIRFEKSYPLIRPHNTNPALLVDEQNPAKKLWLLTVYNPSGKETASRALFIDPESGEIKKEVPFTGIPKFAMPVVFKGKIYISTIDAGMVVIQ